MSDLNEDAYDVCDLCDGTGKIEWAYHANSPEPDGIDKCTRCNGSGYELIPAFPIESFEEYMEAVVYDETTQWW